MRTALRRLAVAAVGAALVAIAIGGCSQSEIEHDAGGGVPLTIGSTGDPELEVVAQLYGQALAADGFDVDYNDGVRTVPGVISALQSGRVDVVPMRLGEVIESVQPTSDIGDRESALVALESALALDDLVPLEPSDARDSAVFVTTTDFAKAHEIDGLEDLTAFPEQLVIGATSDFEDGDYGRSELENAYGIVDWTLHENRTAGDVITDLRSGRDQLAVLSTTDSAAYEDGLVHLADPQGIIGPQYVTPIARKAAASDEVQRVIQAVSSRLTSQDLARFVELSSTQLPETTARDWLASEKLLPTD